MPHSIKINSSLLGLKRPKQLNIITYSCLFRLSFKYFNQLSFMKLQLQWHHLIAWNLIEFFVEFLLDIVSKGHIFYPNLHSDFCPDDLCKNTIELINHWFDLHDWIPISYYVESKVPTFSFTKAKRRLRGLSLSSRPWERAWSVGPVNLNLHSQLLN